MSRSGLAGLRWTAALFDLDGTLVDSRLGILAALSSAFHEVTGGDADLGAVDLSLPLAAMVRSVVPAADDTRIERLEAAFRRHYDAGDWRLGSPYPGASRCLASLCDAYVRVFVVTNKRTSIALKVLEHHQLARWVLAVYGQSDSSRAVAKSSLARQCILEQGLEPSRTVVVGDSDHDAAVAADMGMHLLAATYGVGPLAPSASGAGRIDVGSLTEAAAKILESEPGGGECES